HPRSVVEGQLAQRGPADLTRMPQHAAEIDPARPGQRHRRAIDGAGDLDEIAVAGDPAVTLVIQELGRFHSCTSPGVIARSGATKQSSLRRWIGSLRSQ